MLHLKGTLNVKRQRAARELGVLVHQIEAQESALVIEAEAIHSQVIFDSRMICSQSVLEAKTSCLATVREAKTTRDHSIHQAEAACFKAIHEAAALNVSQSIAFHKEHDRFIRDLEEHAIEDESQSHHDLLSACQATIPNHLEEPWPPHITFYWDKHPHHPQLSCHRRLTMQNSHPWPLSRHQHPNSLPGQTGTILHQSQQGACLQWEGLPTPRSGKPLLGSNL